MSNYSTPADFLGENSTIAAAFTTTMSAVETTTVVGSNATYLIEEEK